MTSRPRLYTDANYFNGFAALLLFVVLAAVFVGAGFPVPEGFGSASITAAIGYAMFDMLDQAAYESESFLVAFEIIDLVLVAALVGAVMLARREDESLRTTLADGGRQLRDAIGEGGDRGVDAADGAGEDRPGRAGGEAGRNESEKGGETGASTRNGQGGAP